LRLEPVGDVVASIGEIERARLQMRLDQAKQKLLIRTADMVESGRAQRYGFDGECLEIGGLVNVGSQEAGSTLTSGYDDKIVRFDSRR
jgi:hypothetical protein